MQECTYINKYGESIFLSKVAPFVLTKIDPNSVGTSAITTRAIGVDGQSTQSVSYNPRTIILDIAITGMMDGRFNIQEYYKNWSRFCKVFIPKEPGTLIYRNDYGIYRIECRPFELPNPIKLIGSTHIISMELVADDPFWLSNVEFNNRLGHVVGGKRFPLKYPLKYGTWIKNARIENDMYIEIPLTIEINSTSLYITVTNETTGEFLKVDNPLTEHQKMIVWTGNEPFVLVQTFDESGMVINEEYANYKLDLNSRYFKLIPGVNNITLDNGYPNSMGSAVIKYRKRYIGV